VPQLTNLQRQDRIRRRIDELEQGVEVAARDIGNLLTTEEQEQLAAAWTEQRQLRNLKKPAELAEYEELNRQASVLVGKCRQTAKEELVNDAVMLRLQTKCQAAILKAHQSIIEKLRDNEQLALWLDRPVDHQAPVSELSKSDVENPAENMALLEKLYEQLPILVSSRSTERRVSVEERFGWRTLREVRLDFLRVTLEKLSESALDDILAEQRASEVQAARVYMDAWAKAYDEDKNAKSAGNVALRRNGFKRLDGQDRYGVSERDREVRLIEEAILARAEAALSDEEREQLELLREHDAAVEKRSRGKGF
jgi:hypothetical protein